MQIVNLKEIESDIYQLEKAQAEMQIYIDKWRKLCEVLSAKGYNLDNAESSGRWVTPVCRVVYTETVSKKIRL